MSDTGDGEMELAALIERQTRLLPHNARLAARAVLAAGFRRDGDDETTVERRARFRNTGATYSVPAGETWGPRYVMEERTITRTPDRVSDWQEVAGDE